MTVFLLGFQRFHSLSPSPSSDNFIPSLPLPHHSLSPSPSSDNIHSLSPSPSSDNFIPSLPLPHQIISFPLFPSLPPSLGTCEDPNDLPCGPEDNGLCYPNTSRCDGHIMCPKSKTDEMICCNAELEFGCYTLEANVYQCFQKQLKCDNVQHCQNMSDEMDCEFEAVVLFILTLYLMIPVSYTFMSWYMYDYFVYLTIINTLSSDIILPPLPLSPSPPPPSPPLPSPSQVTRPLVPLLHPPVQSKLVS